MITVTSQKYNTGPESARAAIYFDGKRDKGGNSIFIIKRKSSMGLENTGFMRFPVTSRSQTQLLGRDWELMFDTVFFS